VLDEFDQNVTEHSESVQPDLKTPSQQSIRMNPGHTRTLSAKNPHQASPARGQPLSLIRSEYEPQASDPLPEEAEILSSESEENSTDRQQRQDAVRRQNSMKEKQKLESILLMKKKFDSGKKLSESGGSFKNSGYKKNNLTEEGEKLIPQAQVGLTTSGGADLDKKSDGQGPQKVTEFKLENSEVIEEITGMVMKNKLFVEDKAADEEARVAKKTAKKEEKQRMLIGDIGNINEKLNFSPEKPFDQAETSDGPIDGPKGDEILEIETKIGIIVENDEC
jgi:hypothetical protein